MRHLCVRAPLALLLCLACPSVATAGRTVPQLAISPHRVTLRLGEAQQFRASLGRKPVAGVTWRLEGDADCGSITPDGYYRAPARCTTPATIHLIAELPRPAEGEQGREEAAASPPLQARATIILSAVAVEIVPRRARVIVGQGLTFRAKVAGAPDQRVTWSVDEGAGSGSITSSGHYSSPPQFLTPGRVTVRATSMADPSKSATAIVTILPIRIQIKQRETTLRLGQSVRLEAKVSGAPNPAVEWRVLGGEANGAITPGGVYTTPSQMRTPAVVTVEARSVADPSKTAQTRIRIQEVELDVGAGPKRDRRKRGGLRGIPLRFYKVVRLTIPFDPLDALVRGPFFQGKSGKRYVPVGGVAVFHAEVRNALNDRVLWSVESGPNHGTINEDGVYLAPDTMRTPAVVQIRATSAADPSKTALLILHVPPILVAAPKEPAVVPLGTTKLLGVRVENAENDAVTWSIEGGEQFGTVTPAGLYTPPPSIATPATVNIRATSVADPSKSTVVQVRIPEVSISLEQEDLEVRPGQSVRLRARVRGCENAAVQWSVVPEVGHIGPDGVYEAPTDARNQVVQIVATCAGDPTKSARATVRIRGD